MELFLWRWSTATQVTSLVIIAAFFAALARSTPRAELRWWRLAWMANLAALTVTLAFWYFAAPAWTEPVVRFSYLWAKTAFVWLFVQGCWALLRPGTTVVHERSALVTVTAFAASGVFLLDSVALVGAGQHAVIAVVFGFCAVLMARAGDVSLTWLAAGLAIRASLAAGESVVYGMQAMTPDPAAQAPHDITSIFLSAHSSLDTAAEWLLALGSVLAISERAQRDVRAYNERLLNAQEDLRRLVDRDPLTALSNRRALPEIFRAVQPEGATLLFFDLDNFKNINDLHGHQTGDACLKRFADALRESFRPDDAVLRYAGDEFLVVASGLTVSGCNERLGRLEERLRFGVRKDGPPIRFSVGIAELAPGGNPERALEAADRAMYRAKEHAAASRAVRG
jgi:diguanylate cyclase (GGDEF)-like protein